MAQRKREAMDAESALAGVLAGMPAWSGGGAEDLVVGGDPVRQRIALFERIERGAQDGLLEVLRVAAESRAEAEREGQRQLAEAQEELARLRMKTQSDADQTLAEAKGRRAAASAELQALETQVEQVRQMMDVFVHRRIQSLRGNLAHDTHAG